MNKGSRRLATNIGILLMGICTVLFVYMTLFRWADFAICIPSIAEKVGVPATMDGIESYLLQNAVPGMKKVDVLKVLEKLGPVHLRDQSANYPPGEFRDTTFIGSCRHPLNNLEIYIYYDSEGELISISLLNNKD